MKTLVLIALLLANCYNALTQSITDDRLLEFLNKVDELRADKRTNAGHMTMPDYYKPDINVWCMPNKDLRFLDSATGIQ